MLKTNQHLSDITDMQFLARTASRELDPGSLQSLLLRRIGFPYKKGNRLAGKNRYVVIVQIGEDLQRAGANDAGADIAQQHNKKGMLKARWFYGEWISNDGTKEQRLIAATGGFNTTTSFSDHRVNIESVALGAVELGPEKAVEAGKGDTNTLIDRIVFKGAARVGGQGGVTFKSEDLNERRFFSLASPFVGDGRANCSVFLSPMVGTKAKDGKNEAAA